MLSEVDQKFIQIEEARHVSEAWKLREKAVCMVTRPGAEFEAELLVFDHVPDYSGVQVPAGGVELGETPAEAASRECQEETGRAGYGSPLYLGSAIWINAEHQKREMRHFFQLAAPPNLPETWDHYADEHLFRFRWVPLSQPKLDWNFDAFLPAGVIP